jgi:hypothetical protein
VPDIRVATKFVRRIVWQNRGRPRVDPATAYYRDGREVAYRAIRFSAGEVHVLSADEDRRIDWGELAELTLPSVDPWTAWFDQLAALCPSEPTRLIEIETSSGLVATASLARWAARFEGNSSDPDRWVHGVQPAWSLDILWVPFRDIALYRSFALGEAPLSRIAPRQVSQHSSLGSARPPAFNRNVLGGPLRSAKLEFGWGIGAAGGTEISFVLPASARSLRTQVCLDRAAGSGGCIRPRIFAGEKKERLLWEGPVLTGSEAVADSGEIRLPGGAPFPVVLAIDALESGRPAGADPLDIRDYGDWCDPLVLLDPAAVAGELASRAADQFIAWRDWEAKPGGGAAGTAKVRISFYRTETIPGAFEAAAESDQPLVLSREVKLAPRDRWLVIAAFRAKDRRQEARLEVRIGGQKAAQFDVPAWRQNPEELPPLVVPLPEREPDGAPASIEIRQEGAGAVQYASLTIAEQLPMLQQVLEEDAVLTAVQEGQSGAAAMTTEDKYAGSRALKVTPSGRFRLELPEVIRVRAQPKWGEARFVRLALRQRGGATVAVEFVDQQPRDPAAIYIAGQPRLADVTAVAMWRDNLPTDWVVITRDLFADFGNIDLKALIVSCPDGEAVLLDQIYLGRHPSDFERLKP